MANTYTINTGVLASSSTVSARISAIYLWSAAANTSKIEILYIDATDTAGVSTSTTLQRAIMTVSMITAENATPGGSLLTALTLDDDDPASSLAGSTGAIRLSATGAPTRTADFHSQPITNDSLSGWDQYVLFDWTRSGQPITLPVGVANGVEVCMTSPGSTITAAHRFSVNIIWRES